MIWPFFRGERGLGDRGEGFRKAIARVQLVRLRLLFVSAYGDGGLGLLGDPTRRAIFELLARRPCSVQQLAEQLPVSRPAVSQHLKVLRDGGLVVARAEGTRRIYSLNPAGVTALRAWLDGVWSDALAGFHKVAESATPLDAPEENP
jgi:DNA-binding transcriptional ArsR family regulator